jgi:hypothetical protein
VHQFVSNVLPNIIGGLAVLLLAFIGKGMLGMRRDFRQFMAEHAWLLATSLWTRDKIMQLMAKLDMPMTEDPPDRLPWHDEKSKK